MVHKVKNGAKNAAPGGSSASECERHCQTICRAPWAQRLAAFDGVGVKCFAFGSMVPDLCRLESNTEPRKSVFFELAHKYADGPDMENQGEHPYTCPPHVANCWIQSLCIVNKLTIRR